MSNVSSVGSNYTDAYSNYSASKTKNTTQAEETKNTGGTAAVSFKASAEGRAAVGKMSDADRAALVSQLKADVQSRTDQLTSIVTKMLEKQGVAIGTADDMWKILAGGNFTVDAATKAQAQADIAEDGYWGVKQTSQRIFDFAMALSGGDQETMKKMRSAFEKGFKQATSAWGKELPSISKDTYDAVEKMFDDYAASFQSDSNE
ncbi:MAG: hypothetical protein J6A11_08415 [Lachnospiraceae bacterium]|nr:hypothetical protein [Lachnospiraceae bacterium]